MLRILTDRGTEYCGRTETHDYQLYLAINDIEHSKTKARSPQTNGICERFHKTILQEFYQVALRKNLYNDLAALQKDLERKIYRLNLTCQTLLKISNCQIRFELLQGKKSRFFHAQFFYQPLISG